MHGKAYNAILENVFWYQVQVYVVLFISVDILDGVATTTAIEHGDKNENDDKTDSKALLLCKNGMPQKNERMPRDDGWGKKTDIYPSFGTVYTKATDAHRPLDDLFPDTPHDVKCYGKRA